MKNRLGWIPDRGDVRDKIFRALHLGLLPAPLKVDHRESNLMPEIWDQDCLGACTANSIGSLFQFVNRKQGHDDFMPSRLFIYYNERVIENTVNSDAGAMIRDGMKVINQYG